MEFDTQFQRRWLVALVCAVLMIVLAGIARMSGGSLITLPAAAAVFFSVAGIFCATMSILAKEKRRIAAYVALAVSSTPWLLVLFTAP